MKVLATRNSRGNNNVTINVSCGQKFCSTEIHVPNSSFKLTLFQVVLETFQFLSVELIDPGLCKTRLTIYVPWTSQVYFK